MEVYESLITDLEEEILFQLSLQETELQILLLTERVAHNMDKIVSVGLVHEILIKLECNGLVQTTISNTRRNYKITATGIATLQTDWSHYKKILNRT